MTEAEATLAVLWEWIDTLKIPVEQWEDLGRRLGEVDRQPPRLTVA